LKAAPCPTVEGRSAWTAVDFDTPRAWVRPLEEAHLEEIDDALAAALQRRLDETTVDAASFPLPALEALLAACVDELEHGPGFAVLAGFPTKRYSAAETRLAFAGLCSHLGNLSAQTCDGDKLIEVVDRRQPYDHTSRGYHSHQALPFHTDGAHAVALLCLETAWRGGESVLVSAASAHNAVATERPDLWQVLAAGFHHHRRGEQPPGEPAISAEPIPVFCFRDGLLHCMYNRKPIEWCEREGLTLDPTQREALDYLDAVLDRPELQLRTDLEVGDLQLVDNFKVLHSRTQYEDRPPQQRHLLRIWLERPASRRSGATLLDLYARP
jgi:alpha-ketoglutarate-dependent taurine dioxygenase